MGQTRRSNRARKVLKLLLAPPLKGGGGRIHKSKGFGCFSGEIWSAIVGQPRSVNFCLERGGNYSKSNRVSVNYFAPTLFHGVQPFSTHARIRLYRLLAREFRANRVVDTPSTNLHFTILFPATRARRRRSCRSRYSYGRIKRTSMRLTSNPV